GMYSPEMATQHDSSGAFQESRARLCGANSLYMLLRLCGRPCTFDQVDNALGYRRNGVTMAELCRASDALGYSCNGIHIVPTDIAKCSFPFIAHLNFQKTTPQAVGHFVLVLGYHETPNSTYVDIIDGTSAKRGRYNASRFAKAWTGYAVAPGWTEGPRDPLRYASRSIVALVGCVAATLVYAIYRNERRRHINKRVLIIATVIILTTYRIDTCNGFDSQAAPCTAEFCRQADCDWINCIYLLQRITGHTHKYPFVAMECKKRPT